MTQALHWLLHNGQALLFGAWLLVALGVGGHVLMTKRNPAEAWGWIAVGLLFPFAGPALYFVFGMNRLRTLARRFAMQRRSGAIGTAHESDVRNAISGTAALPAPLLEVVRTADVMTHRPLLGGNRVRELYDGEQAYPAMLAAIDGAQRSIWLASYIFDNDAVGRRFADALIAAQHRGVTVCVLIDDVGERYSLRRISGRFKGSGVQLARFNPLRLLPPALHLNLRNHRKLLIIDDRIGYTGGMNLSARHLTGAGSGRHAVRDLHFELQGPLLRQMAEVFAEDWAFATRRRLPLPEAPQPEPTPAIARVITDGPNEDIDQLDLVLQAAIAAAQREILIMTPYFLPTPALIAALQGAALRGVDTRVLLPARNNLIYVDWATRHMLPTLLERGVQVRYQGGVFCHSKLLLIDGVYTQIGSANWDPRSLLLNFELNAEFYDENFAARMTAHFEAAWAQAAGITLEALRTRPLALRMRDAVCWLFSPYL
ncbi:cardiolipin synthase [Solimonas aquatica]|uniref:Cardiolipin synthase n=1 Tax=Solimonas aquatica TaxID=489703 RepID=A0A1H9KWC3_9GAMM|nr:phospholipase D-like domain-containing protein [Solimonas aquatica]SER03368.1 cardiolipin synthase [Solimonas aquatica]